MSTPLDPAKFLLARNGLPNRELLSEMEKKSESRTQIRSATNFRLHHVWWGWNFLLKLMSPGSLWICFRNVVIQGFCLLFTMIVKRLVRFIHFIKRLFFRLGRLFPSVAASHVQYLFSTITFQLGSTASQQGSKSLGKVKAETNLFRLWKVC